MASVQFFPQKLVMPLSSKVGGFVTDVLGEAVVMIHASGMGKQVCPAEHEAAVPSGQGWLVEQLSAASSGLEPQYQRLTSLDGSVVEVEDNCVVEVEDICVGELDNDAMEDDEPRMEGLDVAVAPPGAGVGETDASNAGHKIFVKQANP